MPGDATADRPAVRFEVEDGIAELLRPHSDIELVGQPVFRERAVPRRLSLDVAKKDGAERMPAELAAYEARSRAERERRAQRA